MKNKKKNRNLVPFCKSEEIFEDLLEHPFLFRKKEQPL